MSKFEKIVEAFNSQRNQQRKIDLMSLWMQEAFSRIAKVNEKSFLHILRAIKYESEQFCDSIVFTQNEPYIEWYLSPDWFSSVIAQSMKNFYIPTLEESFKAIGWNLQRASFPNIDKRSTIELMNIKAVLPGQVNEIRIKLETKGDCAVGSFWLSTQKILWEIIENKLGRCELQAVDSSHVIWRNEIDILKNFTPHNEVLGLMKKVISNGK